MANRVETDVLVVDEKVGQFYVKLLEEGSQIYKNFNPPEFPHLATRIFPNLNFKTLYCEDATIAHIIMPEIVRAKPRAALLSYAQGNRWGKTPTGKEWILDHWGRPSYIQGTDLAMELKKEIPDIYICLVSDLMAYIGAPIPLPDLESMRRKGIIDFYSIRTAGRGTGRPAVELCDSQGLVRDRLLNMEPIQMIVEHLLAKKE